MKLTRWTIALYMGLVFVCGGVVGAFGHRLYTVSSVSANVGQRNPEEFRKKFLADMKTRLKLTDDQVSKVEAIMDDARQGFGELRTRIEPEVKRIREDEQQKIGALLSPEQNAEWQKIVAEQKRNRQSKRRGALPPP